MKWEAIAFAVGPAAFLLLASRALSRRGLPAPRLWRLALTWLAIILALWAVVALTGTLSSSRFT